MDFKHTEIFNFKGAFRGMRNPMNSWDKSDSVFGIFDLIDESGNEDVVYDWVMSIDSDIEPWSEKYEKFYDIYDEWTISNGNLRPFEFQYYNDWAYLGPNDLRLAQKLILAGPEHAKFLRQIFVSVDITAPLYWWKEFDTYKVGTVANSTSTMHKLAAAPITKEMFEFDNEEIIVSQYTIPHGGECELIFDDYIEDIIDMCETLRLKYKETQDKSYWRALIQILPNAFLQTRTITLSYANLRNIYFQRKNHKLKEWHQFCNWISTLPYAKELITLED